MDVKLLFLQLTPRIRNQMKCANRVVFARILEQRKAAFRAFEGLFLFTYYSFYVQGVLIS